MGWIQKRKFRDHQVELENELNTKKNQNLFEYLKNGKIKYQNY